MGHQTLKLITDMKFDHLITGFYVLTGVFAHQSYVEVPITALDEQPGRFPSIDSDDTTVESKHLYVAKLQIGQKLTKVILDTASSGFWVATADNMNCMENGGSIDCSSSISTFKNDRGTVDVTLPGNIRVGDIPLGVDSSTESILGALTDWQLGLMGIGFQDLQIKNSLPFLLKAQKHIKTAAYSLYFGHRESQKGCILFGAIDHSKHYDNLNEISISAGENGIHRDSTIPLKSLAFRVASDQHVPPLNKLLESFKLPKNLDIAGFPMRLGYVDTLSQGATIDFASTYSYMPQKILDQLLERLGEGINYDLSARAYQVPCSLRQEGNSLAFEFQKLTINVLFMDLIAIWPTVTGEEKCMLGILPGPRAVLGGNFLRSCYSVFNLEKETISLAQVKHSEMRDIRVM